MFKSIKNLFGSKHSSSSPEVEAIFKKLHSFLDSDVDQNNRMPEPFRSQLARGIDCDELPRATGVFGWEPSNPIPSNGPLGEVLYLSRVRTPTGTPIMFHRIGTAQGPLGPVDAYDTLSLDGKLAQRFYLSMYHPRKSKLPPVGYSLSPKLDPHNFTYGVNHVVEAFPSKLDAHIRKWQMEMLGLPLPVTRVREAINGDPHKPSML